MKITRLIVVAMLLVLTGGVAFAQQSKTDETLEFKPHWSLGVQGGVSQTLILYVFIYINRKSISGMLFVTFHLYEL